MKTWYTNKAPSFSASCGENFYRGFAYVRSDGHSIQVDITAESPEKALEAAKKIAELFEKEYPATK